jgi:uncharacterized membrane protein YozB (DUF420 family)
MNHETLPPINATLNAISTVLLLAGYTLIRRDRGRLYTAHGWVMGSAFVVSSVFLALYLLHKYLLFKHTGSYNVSTSGLKPVGLRYFYLFVVLLPHLILAIVMVPLILRVFWLAYKRRWDAHRRLAKPTFWIWLYVSVTGVLIYWMLYHLFPRMTVAAS